MNAVRLLAHFERVADAPSAIPRLRRLILDLAVRGKLVEQDPNDEPAEELLKRITAEKEQLVKEKKISQQQAKFQALDLTEIPFSLPNSWNWCPSTYPCFIISDKGKKIKTKDVVETGKFPVVDQGKMLIRGYHNDDNKVIRVKEPIVLFGDHTRETKLIDFDFIVGADGVKLLQPISIHTPYYFLALQWLPLENRGYGRHFKLLKASFIPLPPLAEQYRIVAKVDELMALCDELEAAQAERETKRERLAAASFACLNEPDPETFRDDARFALNALPALTKRPYQIKQLRRTILNLAVRGKLVEQDPNDEPALELLKRIAAEKARLVKAGEIKKPRIITTLDPDELASPLPQGWVWSQITHLGVINPRNNAPADHMASFIPMPMIFAEYGVLNEHEPRVWSSIRKGYTHFAEGDVGLAKITPCFENGKSTVFHNLTGGIGSGTTELHIVRPLLINPEYILLFLKSPNFIETGISKMTGTAGQKRVPLDYFAGSPFPLPPLAEQHRIVAKVDELMALCDELEANLASGEETRSRLLDALLAEALDSFHKMELAE